MKIQWRLRPNYQVRLKYQQSIIFEIRFCIFVGVLVYPSNVMVLGSGGDGRAH